MARYKSAIIAPEGAQDTVADKLDDDARLSLRDNFLSELKEGKATFYAEVGLPGQPGASIQATIVDHTAAVAIFSRVMPPGQTRPVLGGSIVLSGLAPGDEQALALSGRAILKSGEPIFPLELREMIHGVPRPLLVATFRTAEALNDIALRIASLAFADAFFDHLGVGQEEKPQP